MNIQLEHYEVVRMEQALVEGITRYQRLIADMPPLDREYCSGIYQACINDWQSLLDKLTKLHPDKPRNWSK